MKVPVAKGTSAKAMAIARRLRTGLASDADRRELDFVRHVRELQDRGLSDRAIAQQLARPPKQFAKYVAGSVFRTYVEHLQRVAEAVEEVSDEKLAAEAAKEERARFNRLTPKALDYMERAFEQDKEGKYVDRGLAQWAADRVIKGRGLDVPEHAQRPAININLKIIQQVQAAIGADDRAHKAAIDSTCTELPQLEPPA